MRQANWCFRFDKKNPSLSRHFAINWSSSLCACSHSRSSCRTDQRQSPPGINDRCYSLDKVYSYSRYITYHGFLQLRVTLLSFYVARHQQRWVKHLTKTEWKTQRSKILLLHVAISLLRVSGLKGRKFVRGVSASQ